MSDRAEVASKISDLADLLGERKERIAHAVKIIFENKMWADKSETKEGDNNTEDAPP